MKKNSVCAIINLAGHETRLHPLTKQRPIAALPFAGRYRIIDFSLSAISSAHINSVAIFIEESGRAIYDHVRSGREWDLHGAVSGGIFTFSQQRRKLADFLMLETGERYYENQRIFIDRSEADYVLIMEGDAVHNVDVKALTKFHQQRDAEITIAYKSIPTEKTKTYKADEYYRIDDEDYLEGVMLGNTKEEERHAIDGHVYLVNKEVLFDIFDRAEAGNLFVDIGSLIRSYSLLYRTSMYEYTGYLEVINSLSSYYAANMSMLEPTNLNALFKGSNTINTRSKSGVPTYYAESASVHNAELATGCIIEGTVDSSIISRKSSVAPNAHVSNSIIHSGVKVCEGARVEYAIIEKGAVVQPNAVVVGTKYAPIIIGKGACVECQDTL
ncbi:glucose-1-phosphate adenylyltransferase subunit GlgD [Erysipelothrix anatis]|uniref:glucose-1-phosphate adenylyltransferase subunit GlgD n=1 Tax=Erysipelothrix anatis TaxID=2683713 RepID=UPI001359B3D7|nr:glucose-1-phosphate adenylyltransferase subunit GlgD [Erysipelothrix anatis]